MSRTRDNPDPSRWNPFASRRRKHHFRVFTGCATCRRRHVKCDERAPTCTNCGRLSLRCDYNRELSFKVTLPDDYQLPSKKLLLQEGEIGDSEEHGQLSSHMAATLREGLSDFINESPRSSSCSSPVELPRATEELDLPDVVEVSFPSTSVLTHLTSDPTDYSMLYYNHFLTTVSTILIVYDTPSNSNPYRSFPKLAGSSGSLQNAMIALGAQHLASVSGRRDRDCHYRAAIGAYVESVSQLQDLILRNQFSSKLESLSTSLLLCVFDQLSSADSRWKIHLAGACQVFESIYGPQAATFDEDMAIDISNKSFANSMRRFLVSLLSYLDVAAACATGEGTLISGSYWEKFGGWEYNLGVPSFHVANNGANRVLSQLRLSWSRLMAILADISKFAKTQEDLSDDQRELFQTDLAHRIDFWHNSTPMIFVRLSQLDGIPLGSSDRDIEDLTAAACIQSYAYACKIYLRRVATKRLGDTSTDPDLKLPAEEILRLCLNFSDGLSRMANLWPLFTTGAALADECQQALVRESLVKLKCFGFKVCYGRSELLYQHDPLRKVQACFQSFGKFRIHMAPTSSLWGSQLPRFSESHWIKLTSLELRPFTGSQHALNYSGFMEDQNVALYYIVNSNEPFAANSPFHCIHDLEPWWFQIFLVGRSRCRGGVKDLQVMLSDALLRYSITSRIRQTGFSGTDITDG